MHTKLVIYLMVDRVVVYQHGHYRFTGCCVDIFVLFYLNTHNVHNKIRHTLYCVCFFCSKQKFHNMEIARAKRDKENGRKKNR